MNNQEANASDKQTTDAALEALGNTFLSESLGELRRLEGLAQTALRQVDQEGFFVDAASGSCLAVTVKHLAGSTRSRWTDFLTSDGEKADRNRDGEFVIGREDSRASLMVGWQEAWARCFGAIEELGAGDLLRTTTIRQEPHSVLGAIQRQLGHAAYHVGQIVQLAKAQVGEGWQTMSIPRGGSEAFNAKMRERFAGDKADPPGQL